MPSKFDLGSDPSAIPAWKSVLAIDFAALPSQWINADGPILLGGVSWTKVNSASHVANRFGIVNGTGLLMYGPAGGMPSGNVVSTPMLRLPIVSAVPFLRADLPLRLAIEVAGAVPNPGNEARVFGGFAANGSTHRKGTWAGRAWEGGTGAPIKTFHESWCAPAGSVSGVLPISSDPYGYCSAALYLAMRAFRVSLPSGLGLGTAVEIGTWGGAFRWLGTESMWSATTPNSGVGIDPTMGEVTATVVEIGGLGGADANTAPWMTRMQLDAFY